MSDDDPDVLAIVAHALRAIADVTSVNSVEEARRTIMSHHLDLAVLDVSLGSGSGLDLLGDLRDADGNVIPVIIFSAQDASSLCDEQVLVALSKSQASLESLVATVCDRLAHPSAFGFREPA